MRLSEIQWTSTLGTGLRIFFTVQISETKTTSRVAQTHQGSEVSVCAGFARNKRTGPGKKAGSD